MLSVGLGALLTVLGLLTAEPMMHLMGTPAEILDDAALYLRVYFLGMIPQMLYNMGTNILRAIGDSKRPLYFLMAASLVNIALDVVFIAVFGWGVAGAAWATVLSQVASAVLTLRCIVGSQGMPCTAMCSRPSAPSACPLQPRAPCTTSAIFSSRAA